MRRHRALAAILAGYTLLALGYNLAVPVGEAPDEATHAEYVRHLLRYEALPLPKGLHGADDAEQGITQGGHPPLFYALAAAAAAGLDWERPLLLANPHFSFNRENATVPNAFVHGDDMAWPYAASSGVMAMHAMRLVSLLAGLLLVVATYLTGRATWPDDPPLAWGASAVAAFLPGLLFMSAAVNNDALAAAWAALAVLGAVRIAQDTARTRELAVWGGVVGLALLAKMTALFLVPVLGLALVARAYRTRSGGPGWRGLPRAAATVALGVLAVAGWWFVRSARMYGAADPLGWTAFQRAGASFVRATPLTAELRAYWRTQFATFVGVFGWNTVRLPEPVYVMAGVLCVAAAVGLLVLVARQSRTLDADTRYALAILGVAIVLSYAATLRLGTAMDLSVAQGRYLYVVLGPLSVLFVSGLAAPLPGPWRTWACAALGVGTAALGTFGLLRVLVPAFEPPPALAAEALGAARNRADVDFGDRVRLVGWSLPDGPVRPGESTAVDLYWTGLPGNWKKELQSDSGREWDVPVSVEPELVFAHLVDAEGEVVARVDEAPFGGRMPTTTWRPGAVLRQTVTLPVAADAAPGEGAIRVGIYPEGRADEPLRAWQGGSELGGSYWIGPVTILSTTTRVGRHNLNILPGRMSLLPRRTSR